MGLTKISGGVVQSDNFSVGVITATSLQIGSATTIHTTGIDLGSGNITSHNINSTGIITATGVTVTGNLNVAGVLTYDDVTNIDSVGIITAQSGIHVTGGSVGIGTDDSSEKLTIDGNLKLTRANDNAGLTRYLTIEGSRGSSGGITAFGKLIFNNIDNNSGATTYDAVKLEAETTGNNGGELAIFTTPNASTTAAEVVRITSTGFIGIGTDDPQSILHVSSSTGGGQLRVSSQVNPDGVTITSRNDGTGSQINARGTNSHLRFYTTNSSDTNSEKLRITADGRVGVNTTTPDDTFEVYDGGILAPSRRTISSVIRYGTGIQYRDTSGNQRPILHIQAFSRGVGTGAIGTSNVYVNGVSVRSTGRSWGLAVISGGGSNLGQVLHSQTYDAYVDTNAVTSMINDMATYDTNNNILIVNTYDEPANNANSIRVALTNNYYAKHAENSTHRYAYVHAWRNGYGRLGECNSSTRIGSTFTNQGDNSKANAGISFTVIL